MDTGNYSSLTNQKGANLCLKCTKIRLATRLRPDTLGELMHSPRPPSRNVRGGATYKRKGEREERDGNSPKVKVCRISTACQSSWLSPVHYCLVTYCALKFK